jgi:hypothetical protein
VYAGTQGIDDELGYADQDSAHALIANAQDLLPVAHDYQIDILRIAPLLHVVLHAVRIVDVEEASLGPAEDLRVVGYGFAFGGSVDDGEHLLEVVEDELPRGQLCPGQQCWIFSYSIVKHFILLLQTRHEGVLREVVRPGLVLGVGALDLLIERLDVCGEQAMEFECVALLFRKSRALVEVRSSEKCIALASPLAAGELAPS